MKTLHDREARDKLGARLQGLASGKQAQWGKFTCPQMLAHVADGLRMALGELPVNSKNSPLRYWPLKQLIIYWLPFPKGAPTAPELLARPAQSIDEELRTIGLLLNKFGDHKGHAHWPAHPAFGQLTEVDWGVLQYKHIEHHLRQFGC
ncbi:MAG: DUF1569 domain-containing protein [Acidobacteriota bacterium]